MAAVLVAVVGTLLAGSPAWAVNAQQDKVVSAVPSADTPNAVGGAVFSMAQVGTTIVMGGAFTSIQSPDRATTYDLPYVAAFDQATGQVNTAFAPGLDGQVNAVLPGPTPGTVYVGGAFNNIGGVKAKGLVLLDVSTGSRVAGFATLSMNGVVNTVARTGDRLFVGGTFTQIGGQTRGGIVSMGATTGVVDSFMTSTVTVNHNWTATNGGAKAPVGVSKIDITPDGSRLVAIGNFTFVDGQLRDQVAMWNLGAAAELRTDWQTHRYEPACFSWAYDSYIRDVDFSPDGSYFVIAATGGGNGTLCDTAARFETNASGTDIQPTWVDYAGGDTVLSIAITGTVVYAGGHMRWMNNPNASDFAGGGAVPRPGLVALDPANGMPLSWNPGRNPRGAGAYSLLATAQGLYVGSDTDFIGNRRYFRGKIAFFPLASGTAPASTAVQALPGGAYLGGSRNGASNVLYRVNAGGGAIQSTDAGPDWADGSGSADVSGGNNAGWSPVPNVDATVPASTPRSIFDSERWGAQSWTFPIPSGATVKVRLYFANRYPGTSQVGQRVFNVAINGTTVLPAYDIVADVGDQTGTMKEFPNLTAAADGAVHVDFTNQVENPLVDGIEIVRTDAPEPPPARPAAWSSATSTAAPPARRTRSARRWTSPPCAARPWSATSSTTARPTGCSTGGPSTARRSAPSSWSIRTTTRPGRTWTPARVRRSAAPGRRSTPRSSTSPRCSPTAAGSSTTRCSATGTSTSARSARTAGSSTPTGSPPVRSCRTSPARSTPVATSTTRPGRTGTCPRSRSPPAPCPARRPWSAARRWTAWTGAPGRCSSARGSRPTTRRPRWRR